MRLLILILLFSTLFAASANSAQPSLGELLEQAKQAQDRGDYNAASQAYAKALKLRDDDPALKVNAAQMLLMQGLSKEAAPYLVQALQLATKGTAHPLELKKLICDLLMGRIPSEWQSKMRRQLDKPPIYALPYETQKQMIGLVPKELFFQNEMDEISFVVRASQGAEGLDRLRDKVAKDTFARVVEEILVLPTSKRSSTIDAWKAEAVKTENGYLWVTVLMLYVRTHDQTALKGAFPLAVKAVKKDQSVVNEMALICNRTSWDEGLRQLEPLLPKVSEARQPTDALNFIDAALAAKDEKKARSAILDYSVKFQHQISYLFVTTRMQKIVDLKMLDLILPLIEPATLQRMNRQTQQVLIQGTINNKSLFDALMMKWGAEDLRVTVSLTEVADKCRTINTADAIWLMEQSLRYFPNAPNILSDLSESYTGTGKSTPAIDFGKRAVEAGGENLWTTSVSKLLHSAKRFNKTTEIDDWLWSKRTAFSVNNLVSVACGYAEADRYQDALKWIDEALRQAKAYGWDKDEEQLAQARRTNDSTTLRNTMDALKRTQRLYMRPTYDHRYQWLQNTGRKEEAEKLLAEIKRLFPEQSTAGNRNSRQVRESSPERIPVVSRNGQSPDMSSPDMQNVVLMRIFTTAKNLAKSSKKESANSVAEEMLPLREDMQKGLLLAVDYYKQGASDLMPLVKWLQSQMLHPTNTGTGYDQNTMRNLTRSLYREKGDVMAAMILLSFLLTLPKDVNDMSLQSSFNMLVEHKPVVGINAGFVDVLASCEINGSALALAEEMYEKMGVQDAWIANLKAKINPQDQKNKNGGGK